MKTKDESAGGWATGDFLAKRNKIVIHTHDVSRFTMDVSRIPINWDHKVILAIDGINSELRKRDFSVYPFVRDRYGRWSIVEP